MENIENKINVFIKNENLNLILILSSSGATGPD
jgi:hypothetical protein